MLNGAVGMPQIQGPHASPQAATEVAVPALRSIGAVMSSLGWQGPGEHTVQGVKR